MKSNSSLVWKIKVKLNDNGLVGVFFSPRTTNESGNIVNGTNSTALVNKFGNFRSALYNIELENRSESVFKNAPSIYSFPLTENYFFGPSNIADVSDLLDYCERNNKDDFTIKVWLTECILHSAVMNYIGKNFTKIMTNCPIESLKNIEIKDFICLLEWRSIQNQLPIKALLHVVNKFCIIKRLPIPSQKQIFETLNTGK